MSLMPEKSTRVLNIDKIFGHHGPQRVQHSETEIVDVPNITKKIKMRLEYIVELFHYTLFKRPR